MNAPVRRRSARAPIVLLVAWLVGCGAASTPAPEPPNRSTKLTIGIVPEQSIFRQNRRYDRLLEAVGRRAGVRIETRPLASHATVIEAFEDPGLDGAFLGSFVYAMAHEIVGLEPIARPEAADGRSTYRGLILVRRESGIRGPRDLEGKRFAFVDKATSAGFLFPLDYLAQAGITDLRTFLGESYFAGTHEDVILDVLDGKADAGAAKDTVLARMAAARPEIARDLVAIGHSPEFPDNALALRTAVDPALRRTIRDAMLGMSEDADGRRILEAFGARRFVPATDADYAAVVRYAQEVAPELDRLSPKDHP